MNSKVIMLAIVSLGLVPGSACAAAPSDQASEQAALSQCVALKTSGADRILTARWLFAVMSKSSQIADLSAVTPERAKSINQDFAKLVARLVSKDCIDQVRPLAAVSVEDAFGQVGTALGHTAMKELMSGNEFEKAIGEYTDFLSVDDFKPLMDSLPTKAKQP